MITLIDYGAGNLHSLEGALDRLGFQHRRAERPDQAAPGGALVLPGVGHFHAAQEALKERGWWRELPQLVADGRPLLGICLGLQLLAEGSEESPKDTGLGLIPGISRRLGPGVKVPLMGWAQVQQTVGASGPARSEGRLALLRPQLCPGTPGRDRLHGLPRASLLRRQGAGARAGLPAPPGEVRPLRARAAAEGPRLDG